MGESYIQREGMRFGKINENVHQKGSNDRQRGRKRSLFFGPESQPVEESIWKLSLLGKKFPNLGPTVMQFILINSTQG